ncbi:MAG: hypothetical protein ABI867_26990 [Kofleriaceae bacterium]
MIWIVVIVLIVGLGFGVFSTLRLVQWSPRRAELANEDDSQIQDGTVVTVTGKVRLVGEPLITPLSARRCVMFEAYANLYEWNEGDGDGEGEKADGKKVLMAQLARSAMVPFELETTIGVISIDGTDADVELVPVPVFPRRPEREALFLREHDRDERLIENAKFEEVSVDPDSLVSVTGLAIVEGPTKIRLVADGSQPLIIGLPRKTAIT